MNKIKKDRELHKYLSKFGEDYSTIIVSKGRLDKNQVASAIKKLRQKIHGGEFYFSIIDVGGDIDIASDEVFEGLEPPLYSKPTGKDPDKTRLANYIEQLVVEHRDIAYKIGTKPINLSHSLNGVREIYAYQIYFLAKVHGKSPSEVFEYLYGPEGIGRIT